MNMSTSIQEKNGDNLKQQLQKRTRKGRQSTKEMRTKERENKVQGLPGGPRALGPPRQKLAKNKKNRKQLENNKIGMQGWKNIGTKQYKNRS